MYFCLFFEMFLGVAECSDWFKYLQFRSGDLDGGSEDEKARRCATVS